MEVEGIVRDYFTGVFTPTKSLTDIDKVTATICSRFSKEDNNFLIQGFKAEEFRTTISQMHKDKSLDPDGFSLGFYQMFWGMLGPDIVDACVN